MNAFWTWLLARFPWRSSESRAPVEVQQVAPAPPVPPKDFKPGGHFSAARACHDLYPHPTFEDENVLIGVSAGRTSVMYRAERQSESRFRHIDITNKTKGPMVAVLVFSSQSENILGLPIAPDEGENFSINYWFRSERLHGAESESVFSERWGVVYLFLGSVLMSEPTNNFPEGTPLYLEEQKLIFKARPDYAFSFGIDVFSGTPSSRVI